MATQTKNGSQRATKSHDPFDMQDAVESWTEASRKAATDYIELVEKAVEQLTDLQLKTADAVKVPRLSSVVETQVELTRQVAGTYTKTARELLKA